MEKIYRLYASLVLQEDYEVLLQTKFPYDVFVDFDSRPVNDMVKDLTLTGHNFSSIIEGRKRKS